MLQEAAEGEIPGVDRGQNWAFEHRDLGRAFAALPEEQRSSVLLIGVEDLSHQQAARVLGVPIDTVMSRLSRGRERLRHYMNGDTNGDKGRRNVELRSVK